MNKRDKTQLSVRRTVAQVAAVVAALALILLGVVGSGVPSYGDERSDAVNERNKSEREISTLREDLGDIDSEIADLVVRLEETLQATETARANLAVAEENLAAAERHHDQILGELEQAQAEVEVLTEEISDSEDSETRLSAAVADMARDLYRGGNVSPFEVVMSEEALGDISARTAAATSLGRVQSIALSEVRTLLVVKENQMARQEAVTERITALEAEAAQARDEAESARNEVEANVVALEASLAQQEQAQAEWESRKEVALGQLAQAQGAKERADATIQRIDRENAEKARQEEARRQQQANQSKPSTPAQPSTPTRPSTPSSPSTSAPAPTGRALFVNPFRFPMRITSPFGYRIHPTLGYRLFHSGTDIAGACGTSQHATRAGTVAQTGYHVNLGYFVRINHGMINGRSYVTEHAHLSQILVSTGQSVSTSTVIGLTGTTGRSTGCHLHLGLSENGRYVNILNYM